MVEHKKKEHGAGLYMELLIVEHMYFFLILKINEEFYEKPGRIIRLLKISLKREDEVLFLASSLLVLHTEMIAKNNSHNNLVRYYNDIKDVVHAVRLRTPCRLRKRTNKKVHQLTVSHHLFRYIHCSVLSFHSCLFAVLLYGCLIRRLF